MNVLVFDIGTTSMRGILYNQKGEELAQASRLTPLIFEGTYIEQDPLVLKERLYSIAKEIADAHKIDAISLTAFRSAPALFAQDGSPLSNFIMWQDTRNREICERLMPQNKELYAKTGAKVNTVFAASKITWLKQNKKEEYGKAYKVLVVPAYLLYLMTNEWKCDVSYGSRTGVTDIRTHDYDAEILEVYDLDRDKLADLVEVGSVIGAAKGEFCIKCGIEEGIPVISTGGDQQNSALGLGEFDGSSLVINCGTGGFVIGLSNEPYLENDAVICNTSAIPGKYVLESNVLASAAALNWTIKEFFPEIWKEGNPDFAGLNKIIASSPLGSNGVICVPLFQGCGSRDWNPDARASFSHISLGNTRADFGRAVFEGIAAEIVKSVASLPGGADRDVIYIGGGLTKSDFFDQILSDMLGVTLVRYEDAQATAIGSFISASVTLGIYADYKAAFKAVRGTSKTIEYTPDKESYEKYREVIAKSEEVYKKLK